MTLQNVPMQGVAEAAQPAVEQFVVEIQERLGQDLRSVTVIGSAAGSDFQPGVSDINTVLVLKELHRKHLDGMTGLAKSLRKRRLALPLMMTPAYIERSRDVFGVELLDFQLSGQTVLGDDPFKALTFERSDVRLQCERELKAMLIRLRQGYVASAGKSRLLRDVLVSAGKTLLPYLRAMVWLNQGTRDSTIQGTLNQAREILQIDTAALNNLVQWRNPKVKVDADTLVIGFDQAYAVILKLADWVDAHEV